MISFLLIGATSITIYIFLLHIGIVVRSGFPILIFMMSFIPLSHALIAMKMKDKLEVKNTSIDQFNYKLFYKLEIPGGLILFGVGILYSIINLLRSLG